jgi:membrane protease YdiL (CAAX protease family)
MFVTIAWAAVWTALMLAYGPFADWIATKLFVAPPTLGAFRAIQESRVKLLIGIVVAWLLGGFLEELVFRGVVLRAVELGLARLAPHWIATAAVVVAATALQSSTTTTGRV